RAFNLALRAHAAAGVQQYAQADGLLSRREERDTLWHAIFEQRKARSRKSAPVVASSVHYPDADRKEIDVSFECGRLRERDCREQTRQETRRPRHAISLCQDSAKL